MILNEKHVHCCIVRKNYPHHTILYYTISQCTLSSVAAILTAQKNTHTHTRVYTFISCILYRRQTRRLFQASHEMRCAEKNNMKNSTADINTQKEPQLNMLDKSLKRLLAIPLSANCERIFTLWTEKRRDCCNFSIFFHLVPCECLYVCVLVARQTFTSTH